MGWGGVGLGWVAGGGGSQYPIPKIIYHKYPVSLSYFFFKYPEIVFGQISRIPI